MRKNETILIVLSIFSLVLNLFSISGANPWPVITLVLLSMLYLFFGFAVLNNIRLKGIFKKESYIEMSKTKIAGAVFIGLALFLTLIGILFRFKYWPNSSVILETGLGGLLLVTIIGLIKYPRTESDYFRNIFRRIVIVGGLGLLFMIIPQNTWVKIKYRNHPQCSDALKALIANPYETELWDYVELERQMKRCICTIENLNTKFTILNGDTIQSVTLYDSTSIKQVKEFDRSHRIQRQFILLPNGDTIFDPKLVYAKDFTKLFIFLPLRSRSRKDIVFENANLLLYRNEGDFEDTLFYGQVHNEDIISIKDIDTANLISRIYYKDEKRGFAEVYLSRLINPNEK